jgi:hypothetical protein
MLSIRRRGCPGSPASSPAPATTRRSASTWSGHPPFGAPDRRFAVSATAPTSLDYLLTNCSSDVGPSSPSIRALHAPAQAPTLGKREQGGSVPAGPRCGISGASGGRRGGQGAAVQVAISDAELITLAVMQGWPIHASAPGQRMDRRRLDARRRPPCRTGRYRRCHPDRRGVDGHPGPLPGRSPARARPSAGRMAAVPVRRSPHVGVHGRADRRAHGRNRSVAGAVCRACRTCRHCPCSARCCASTSTTRTTPWDDPALMTRQRPLPTAARSTWLPCSSVRRRARARAARPFAR